VIRPIGAPHAQDCAAIHSQSFAHPWSVAEIEQLLLAKEVFADGAFEPKTKVLSGFVLSRRAADEAEILTIAVDPAYRRRGIGFELLRSHISQLTLQRVRSLFLEVDENNASARALYAQFGFLKVGERKSYYRTPSGEKATAYIMRLDL
jgi:ribosomal-protein-alanine N-acetyltransferase